MKANRDFELIVTRGGRVPALLDPDRVDHVEIVEVASGEVVLFWDVLPHHTRRLARALRADLAQMQGADFIAKWRRYEAG